MAKFDGLNFEFVLRWGSEELIWDATELGDENFNGTLVTCLLHTADLNPIDIPDYSGLLAALAAGTLECEMRTYEPFPGGLEQGVTVYAVELEVPEAPAGAWSVGSITIRGATSG